MQVTKAEKEGQVSGLRSSALFAIDNYKHKLLAAEIGVCTGVNAYQMVSQMDIGMLYLIDPYAPYVGGITYETNSQDFQDRAYAKSFMRLVPFHRFVTFITKPSAFAAHLFPSALFHYVYIDGNHLYEFVKEDCNAWWPKVKPGYVMAGHDYREDVPDGVKKAVNEFVLENNLKLTVFKDSDWLIEKPN